MLAFNKDLEIIVSAEKFPHLGLTTLPHTLKYRSINADKEGIFKTIAANLLNNGNFSLFFIQNPLVDFV